MKLEDLQSDISSAYQNYNENDLKSAVMQLDISANALLQTDKSLDPIWTSIAKDIYIGVMLNNFSKVTELSIKDLREMLNDQNVVYNNIVEFCKKMDTNTETNFATRLKKITEKPLKDGIQILKENIDKLE